MKKGGRFLRIPSVLPLRTKGLYHEVPSHDLSNSETPYSDASPFDSPLLTPTSRRGPKPRWHKIARKLSVKRILAVLAAICLLVIFITGGIKRRQRRLEEEAAREREKNRPKYHWESFPRYVVIRVAHPWRDRHRLRLFADMHS